jgi:hypothetical protein
LVDFGRFGQILAIFVIFGPNWTNNFFRERSAGLAGNLPKIQGNKCDYREIIFVFRFCPFGSILAIFGRFWAKLSQKTNIWKRSSELAETFKKNNLISVIIVKFCYRIWPFWIIFCHFWPILGKIGQQFCWERSSDLAGILPKIQVNKCDYRKLFLLGDFGPFGSILAIYWPYFEIFKLAENLPKH